MGYYYGAGKYQEDDFAECKLCKDAVLESRAKERWHEDEHGDWYCDYCIHISVECPKCGSMQHIDKADEYEWEEINGEYLCPVCANNWYYDNKK